MRIVDRDGKIRNLNSFDNWDWDSDEDGTDDEVSEKTRTLKYNVITDAGGNPRPLQLTKQVHQDFIPKETKKKGVKVQTVKNTIPGWPGYSQENDEFFEPEPKSTSAGPDAHEQEIKRLKEEMEQMRKHCKETLEQKDKINEQQRTLLETTLRELEILRKRTN